jgi:hypothetical protein
MSTSGVVSTTVIQVRDFIDHAWRRCKLEPSKITAQDLEFSRRNLYYYLSSLSNIGLDLWTIERVQVGFIPGKRIYAMPQGCIDVLNVNYRLLTFNSVGTPSSSAGGIAASAFDLNLATACTQTAPNGNISMDFGSGTDIPVSVVGIITNGNVTNDLVWESSPDNINWTTVLVTGPTAYTNGSWQYYDIPIPIAAEFFRVREVGGNTLNVTELCFGNLPVDIPIVRLNRDDYANLPFKDQQATFPTQYWEERVIPVPNLWMWPVPNDLAISMQVWYHRYIQDVISFTDQIEVPQRWYENILANLAARCAVESEKVNPQQTQLLMQMAASAEMTTTAEERDKSPMFLTPNISHYTR